MAPTAGRQSAWGAAAGLPAAFAMFFWFAGDGLAAYFTPDDMMNMYQAWREPWGSGRLAGALFYNLGFRAWGLEPLWFRIACFAMLSANLALVYLFALRLARSRGVAALACLLGAYHAHLADLYYSTGTVYDLLCGMFWFGAFTWYATIRERGKVPGWAQIGAILALYGAALESKELAVTLPAFVALYELLYHGGAAGRRSWRWVAVSVLPTAAFFAWKFAGPENMSANPAYAIQLSTAVWTRHWRHYLSDLFYGAIPFSGAGVVALWAVLLLVAAALRRRDLLFAWCLMFFAALPVILIAQRGLYALYLTLPGWWLYFAGLIDTLLPKRLPRRHTIAFVALAAVLVPLHTWRKPRGKEWVEEAFSSIRNLRVQLKERYPSMPPGARVLFVSDPYPEDDWIVTFIFRLHYRDPEIRVDRLRQTGVKPAARETYQYVFEMTGGKLARLNGGG